MQHDKRAAYWRANLRLVGLCLAVWFVCSFGFGVLFVVPLNQIRLGGFQLGFWFAQQGAVCIFVALIFFYAWRMNKLDRRHGVAEKGVAEQGVAEKGVAEQGVAEKGVAEKRTAENSAEERQS